MGIRKFSASRSIFPLLVAVSLFVGRYIPAFYDWTGSDQSRPSPLIWQTALGLATGGLIVMAVLPWLPITTDPKDIDRPVRVRFKIRTMLLLTAAVAAVIAALMKFPMVVSGLLCAIAVSCLVRFWIVRRQYRWQTVALPACMSFPYAWIIGYDALGGISPRFSG